MNSGSILKLTKNNTNLSIMKMRKKVGNLPGLLTMNLILP